MTNDAPAGPCACLKLVYKPITTPDGTYFVRWACEQCGSVFRRDHEFSKWAGWLKSIERCTRTAVQFVLYADENRGLMPSQIAPKLEDWAANSGGPPAAVYAGVAAALRDEQSPDRPEVEVRRVPKRPDTKPNGGSDDG